jgi:hypothetical protein
VTARTRGERRSEAEGSIFAIALLVLVVAWGTAGYMLIEGWSAWDAFYMTIITVTTVGYKEVHELSGAGQAFTVVILLSGVARRSTRSRCWPRPSSRGVFQEAFIAGGGDVCWTRSRIISSSADTGASAA